MVKLLFIGLFDLIVRLSFQKENYIEILCYDKVLQLYEYVLISIDELQSYNFFSVILIIFF